MTGGVSGRGQDWDSVTHTCMSLGAAHQSDGWQWRRLQVLYTQDAVTLQSRVRTIYFPVGNGSACAYLQQWEIWLGMNTPEFVRDLYGWGERELMIASEPSPQNLNPRVCKRKNPRCHKLRSSQRTFHVVKLQHILVLCWLRASLKEQLAPLLSCQPGSCSLPFSWSWGIAL